MRRVAILSPLGNLSGSDRALVRLVVGLDRRRIDPLVVIPAEGPLSNELESAGIPFLIHHLRWWIPATHWTGRTFAEQAAGLASRAASLGREFAERAIEVVHTNTLVNLEGALAAAALGLPHVFHSRGLLDDVSPPPYFRDRRFLFGVVDRLCDVLLCVSDAVERQANAWCRRAARFVIQDGVDLRELRNRPASSRTELLSSLGLREPCRLLVCLGGLQRRKGQLDLVSAMALVAAQMDDAYCVLAGDFADSDYVELLRAAVDRLGLRGRILMPGFIPDVRSLLEHAEVVVHPSHSEGFGLAVLEAMALGRAVVATRSGGPEAIVEHGRSGLLVGVGAPEELAQALLCLLSDPGLRRHLGAEAGARALHFDLPAANQAIERVYLSLEPLSGRRAVHRRQLAGRIARCVEARIRAVATE